MFDNWDWRDAYIDISYLVAAICFIFGLKMLSNPTTARRGNQLAAVGMALAMVATLFMRGMEFTNIILILVAIVIGAAVWVARQSR
jgi:H+-translocating NAD(P) transhydrogenase subunit beta